MCDSNDGVSVARERDNPIAFGCLLVGLLMGNFETHRGELRDLVRERANPKEGNGSVRGGKRVVG